MVWEPSSWPLRRYIIWVVKEDTIDVFVIFVKKWDKISMLDVAINEKTPILILYFLDRAIRYLYPNKK